MAFLFSTQIHISSPFKSSSSFFSAVVSTMAETPPAPPPGRVFAGLIFLLLSLPSVISIGINYGTLSDELPPPSQVAAFLKNRTTIDRVKIFDCNPDMLRAFAGSGISVLVTAPNGDISTLSHLPGARDWVASHIAPFYPATNISLIAVGNEIMAFPNSSLVAELVPAMRSLSAALSEDGFSHIRVSTPHALGILEVSWPPSAGRFYSGHDQEVFAPMLKFHRESNSPFLVNPYPYFGYTDDTLDYALFRPNTGVYDPVTKINYTNMFDAQMDAVFSAMNRLGYGDVDIAIGETGWPTAAEPGQAGVGPSFAATYVGNLMKHVSSGKGTPLMPNRRFETYIFSLFNENLKPGPIAERNWGLFRPDFSPVYDVGILRGRSQSGTTPLPPLDSSTIHLGSRAPPPPQNSSAARAFGPSPKSGDNVDESSPTPSSGASLNSPFSCLLFLFSLIHVRYYVNLIL